MWRASRVRGIYNGLWLEKKKGRSTSDRSDTVSEERLAEPEASTRDLPSSSSSPRNRAEGVDGSGSLLLGLMAPFIPQEQDVQDPSPRCQP